MNDLTPQPQSKPPERLTFPKASASLTKLLVTEGGSLALVDEITAHPGLHAEAIALLPELEAYIAPAGADGVRSILSALFVIYPQPIRDQSEWAAWWMTYMEDLETFPMWSLEAAARDYRRDPESQFFPKPGQLRGLANQHALVAVKALGRVRMASKQPIRRLFSEAETTARQADVSGALGGLKRP